MPYINSAQVLSAARWFDVAVWIVHEFADHLISLSVFDVTRLLADAHLLRGEDWLIGWEGLTTAERMKSYWRGIVQSNSQLGSGGCEQKRELEAERKQGREK